MSFKRLLGSLLVLLSLVTSPSAQIISGAGGGTGRQLFFSATDTATTGTSLQNLYTFSVPQGTLTTAGQLLRVHAVVTTAATVNNKTVTITFGATTIFTTTSQPFNNSYIEMWCDIFATAATAQKAMCYGPNGTTNTLVNDVNVNTATTLSTPAENNGSGAVVMNVTGTTPTILGDLTARMVSIQFYNQP